MQLPRKVIIGDKIITDIIDFIKENTLKSEKIALVTGINVKEKIDKVIENSFLENNIQHKWIIVKEASFQSVQYVENEIGNEKIEMIAGIGGGRCIDIGKMAANNLKKNRL